MTTASPHPDDKDGRRARPVREIPEQRSFAKINLFLEVVDKRSDGFHNLESVFVEIDMPDGLSVETTPEPGIVLTCSGDGDIPTDKRNLVVKAVDAVRRRCGAEGGMRLHLRKTVPAGSGLGGGSANAALALRLANTLWDAGLDREALAELALGIGSDVPFFLEGGTCLCRGRGEIITRLPDFPAGEFVILAMPAIHSGTAAAFGGLRLPDARERRSADAFVRALAAGDADGMEREAFNRFETTVFAALPELARIHDELEALCGRPVRMSGSGAALWHFADAGYAAALADNARLIAWAEKNRVALRAVRAGVRAASGRQL